MNKVISMLATAVACLAIAGCGGSSSTGGTLIGQSGGGSSGSTSATTLSLLASAPQLPSGGSNSVTFTALVENSNNNVVSGAPVTFAATSGALVVNQTTTGANGTATATLNTGGDPANRTITVKATSGSVSSSTSVNVVGTNLSLSGPTTLVTGSSGTYTVTLVDSTGAGIPGETITITSAKDNTLSASSVTTNSAGQATFKVTAVNSGNDTISVATLGMKSSEGVAVSSNSFKFTSPTANQNVDIGTTTTVTVVWTNAGVAENGQTVNFSATRGTLSSASAITNSSGSASVTITSTTAGPSLISATGSGVSAQVPINFVATTPSTMDVQANPATIAPQGQSTITATVYDANGNLVEGQTVNFTIAKDTTGGSLSAPSAITNSQGVATTTYDASTSTSSLNGVVIDAAIPGTAVSGSTSLTVGGQTVFLSLGTGNTLSSYSSTQYELPYSVQAVDSAGNPVSGVQVTFTVSSLGYLKGQRVWTASSGSGSGSWVTESSTTSSDPYAYVLDGIDGCIAENPSNPYNGLSQVWPGQVVSTDVSSATTGSDGTAKVNLIYPKDHALYVAVELTATAQVSGSQSSSSVSFWLPILTTDISSENQQPPGQYSPYGTASQCSSPN